MKKILYSAVAIAAFALLHIVMFGIALEALALSSDYLIPTSLMSAAVLFFLNAGPRIRDNYFTSSLYVLASTWLGVLFLLLTASLLYKAQQLVFGHNLNIYFALHALALIMSAYALLNARRLETNTIEIPIRGLAKPIRVAHLSDIHIGTVHRATYLQRVVVATNAESPDLVLVTGDLFDGSAPIHEEMLRPLDELTAPAYFSTGNHEEYEGLPLVYETIANLKLQLLANDTAEFDGVQVIGVSDRESLPKEQSLNTILPTLNYDKEKPTILMYHTPVEWEQARAAGIDLMLSGHTHNGQVWPFTILVHFAFKYVVGLFKEKHQYLHISSGTGTWGPPMRLGSRNQIVILNLVPEK